MGPSEPVATAGLLLRAGQAIGRFRRRAAGAHGLSATAMGVLTELAGADGASHRELAARLGVTPATLTPVVDALDATGDLTRGRDPADRRVVRLRITDAGRAHIATASASVDAALGERMPSTPDGVREHLLAVLAAFEDGER